jgi:hypothetical protein
MVASPEHAEVGRTSAPDEPLRKEEGGYSKFPGKNCQEGNSFHFPDKNCHHAGLRLSSFPLSAPAFACKSKQRGTQRILLRLRRRETAGHKIFQPAILQKRSRKNFWTY